jgi:hypothetical protein
MYLESMLGKMAKDIPGLVERMEAAAASAATEDMVGSLLETSFADPDPGSGAFLTPGSGIRHG